MADLLNDADFRIQLSYAMADQDGSENNYVHPSFTRWRGFLPVSAYPTILIKYSQYVVGSIPNDSVSVERLNQYVVGSVPTDGVSVEKFVQYVVSVDQPRPTMWPTRMMRHRLSFPEEFEEIIGLNRRKLRYTSPDVTTTIQVTEEGTITWFDRNGANTARLTALGSDVWLSQNPPAVATMFGSNIWVSVITDSNALATQLDTNVWLSPAVNSAYASSLSSDVWLYPITGENQALVTELTAETWATIASPNNFVRATGLVATPWISRSSASNPALITQIETIVWMPVDGTLLSQTNVHVFWWR